MKRYYACPPLANLFTQSSKYKLLHNAASKFPRTPYYLSLNLQWASSSVIL